MNPLLTDTCSECGRQVSPDQSCDFCLLSLAVLDAEIEAEEEQIVLRRFGDYELLDEIARGGMGVVYRARQISLDREVAIKLILAGQLATPESVERFRLEARASAQLDHPAIVPIYEVNEYETQHFFSMKLIAGTSLAECRQAWTLPARGPDESAVARQKKIAAMLAKVASAISYSHQHRVLHRDLKPANILIDQNDQPLLIDFGLAKLTGYNASGLTLSSTLLGSPSYMAPEQAAGAPEHVTTSADVYGLGAVLYELLTDQPPFLGQNALATMRLVTDQPPKRPRNINPVVHRDLETITLKCLRKQPESRYATAKEVADDLQAFVDGRPIRARPIGTIEALQKWCRRKPVTALTIVSIVLLMASGFFAVAWQWRRAESANKQLTDSIAHLEWRSIVENVDREDNSASLAALAARLRANPDDWQAAMLSSSILRYRNFVVPASVPLTHGSQFLINEAGFDADARRIATAGNDGTVRLWQLDTGLELCAPMQHDADVNAVCFSPDGALLASASADHTARLWNTVDGVERHRVTHDDEVKSAEFSRDGACLMSASADGDVRFTNADSGESCGPAIRTAAPLSSVRFNASGTRIIAAAAASVSVWDVSSTPTLVTTLPHDRNVRGAQFAMSDKMIVSQDVSGTLHVWNVDTAELRDTYRAHPEFNWALSRDGQYMAVQPRRHTARVVDLSTGQFVTDEIAHDYEIMGVAFDPTTRRVASCAWDYTGRITNIDSSGAVVNPFFLPAVGKDLSFSNDGRLLLVRVGNVPRGPSSPMGNGAALVWRCRFPERRDAFISPSGNVGLIAADPEHGHFAVSLGGQSGVAILDRSLQPVGGTLPHQGSIFGLLFSRDGSQLIGATNSGQVHFWSVPGGEAVCEPLEEGDGILSARLSPDGGLLAVATQSGFVSLWNTKTRQRHGSRMDHGGEMNDVVFSHDGQLLASASDSNTAKVWRVDGCELITTVSHQYRVQTINFSPDDQFIVTASNDFSAQVWETDSGRPVGSPMKHQGEVGYANFDSSGSRVVTCSRDATTRIWDARTGRPLVAPMAHESAVREAMFSPDDRLVVTCDHEGGRAWDSATGQPVTVHISHSAGSGIGYDSAGVRSVFVGEQVFTGVASQQVELFDFSRPQVPVPAEWPDFLEGLAAEKLNENGVHVRLHTAECIERLRGAERIRSPLYRELANRWQEQQP